MCSKRRTLLCPGENLIPHSRHEVTCCLCDLHQNCFNQSLSSLTCRGLSGTGTRRASFRTSCPTLWGHASCDSSPLTGTPVAGWASGWRCTGAPTVSNTQPAVNPMVSKSALTLSSQHCVYRFIYLYTWFCSVGQILQNVWCWILGVFTSTRSIIVIIFILKASVFQKHFTELWDLCTDQWFKPSPSQLWSAATVSSSIHKFDSWKFSFQICLACHIFIKWGVSHVFVA